MPMSPQPGIEKRALNDHASESTVVLKKQKTESAEIKVNNEEQNGKVDPSELASAFALASLASLSPGNQVSATTSAAPEKDSRGTDSTHETRREGVEKVESFEEARSPKADQAPTSPEQRFLGSPKSQDEPSTPEDSVSATSARRVHFAPSTKQQPSTPSSILRSRQVPASHRMVVPPQHQVGSLVARPHHQFGMGGFLRTPPQMHHHHHQTPPHQPHAFHHVQPWFPGRIYPPQRLMQPPLMHPPAGALADSQWICDYCNVASFATYQEACVHEETCRIRCAMAKELRQGMNPASTLAYGPHHRHLALQGSRSLSMSRSSSGEEDTMALQPSSPGSFVSTANNEKWFSGSLSLAMEVTDREWLSELNCFVRKHCVEAFSATEEDVQRSSKRGRIAIHQVGIRCKHCAHLHMKDKAVAAVSFPTSIAGIYESVKRWQRVHLEVCDLVPQDIHDKLAVLANTSVWVPTTRQYWSDSAKDLGLVDTHQGIRFSRDPVEVVRNAKQQALNPVKMGPGAPNKPVALAHAHQSMGDSMIDDIDPHGGPHNAPDFGFVVFPEDMEMIPPYVYFLMRQVEPCRFTEADRFVARSKGPVGYPGFQCRHCNGHAGLGKYFPVSAKSLSTNSTSQNIHAHLLKCRKCPEHTKDQLVQLKIEKGRSPRLEPGWRKVFFDKVWGRLHG